MRKGGEQGKSEDLDETKNKEKKTGCPERKEIEKGKRKREKRRE